MKEDWEKENIEKSKEVLKDYFERKRRERREDLCIPRYTTLEIHSGSNWEITDEDFLDFNKERKEFFDKLIWDGV